MNELLNVDFGKPLHSFVIPGDTHFIEQDVLKMYGINGDNDGNLNDDNDESIEQKEQKEKVTVKGKGNEKEEEWNGIDFNGIWQLEESENLDAYLLSEGWSAIQKKSRIKINYNTTNYTK